MIAGCESKDLTHQRTRSKSRGHRENSRNAIVPRRNIDGALKCAVTKSNSTSRHTDLLTPNLAGYVCYQAQLGPWLVLRRIGFRGQYTSAARRDKFIGGCSPVFLPRTRRPVLVRVSSGKSRSLASLRSSPVVTRLLSPRKFVSRFAAADYAKLMFCYQDFGGARARIVV